MYLARMSLTIPARFQGPPACANGGYAAGAIACSIASEVAVRLHRPVPLDTELTLSARTAEGWELHERAGGVCIASARKLELALEIPSEASISYERAVAASLDYDKFENLRSSGCFVCGKGRALGDGLRIFPGVLGEQLVAAPWRPDASVADASGRVYEPIVWAALDCPGYFAAFQDGRYALLGELAARLEQPVRAGEDYFVVAWSIATERRKRFAGSALFDRAGRRLAFARATWIEVVRQASLS